MTTALLPPPTADLTRRRLLRDAATLLVVTACAPTGEVDTGAEGATPRTRRVEHALGATEVPRQPRRIAAMWPDLALNLHALGATVVSATDPLAADPDGYRERLGTDVARLGGVNEPDLEALAGSRPDMIVTAAVDGRAFPDNEQLLSRVAPTVAVVRDAREWRRMIGEVARLAGRVEQAERPLAEIDAAVADLRTQVEDLGWPTANYVTFTPEGEAYVFVGELPAALLDDVGFARPDEFRLTDADPYFRALSAEQITRMDADLLVVGVSRSGADGYARYRASPLWQRLDAVRNDRVVEVDAEVWIDPALPNIRQAVDALEGAVRRLR